MQEPIIFQSRGHVVAIVPTIRSCDWIALVYDRLSISHVRTLTGRAATEDEAREQAVEALRAVRKTDDAPYLRAMTRHDDGTCIVGIVLGGEKRWAIEVLRKHATDDAIEIYCSLARKSPQLAEAVVADEMRRAAFVMPARSQAHVEPDSIAATA